MSKIDISSLDVKLLRMFLAVFEEKSVTRAAERLECSQSAVSHGLDRLRQCIGDPLFVKHGRSIAATPVATSIVPKVTEILIAIEGLTLQGEYIPEEDRSTFTIAANLIEHMSILSHIHHDLRLRHPDVSLGMVELGARTNALPFLEKGMADAAITIALGQHPMELMVERFYQDVVVCFYDPDHVSAPTTPEEYYAARHAVVDFGGNTKSVVDAALENTGASRQILLRAANSYALANLVRGTDLLITMPRRLAFSVFDDFAVCAPPIPLPTLSYDLVCHRRGQSSARQEWFMDAMRTAVQSFKKGPELSPPVRRRDVSAL
ncbi:MAG: LysR family transcriptional regulator [Pseudomonadota bacterium]